MSTLLVGLSVLSGACARISGVEEASAVQEPAIASFDAVPVYQVITPWGNAGSAVRVSESTFITARHVLPRRGDDIELRAAGQARGKPVRFTRLAAGEGAGTANDWAVFRVAEPLDTPFNPSVAAIKPRPTTRREGERGYILGFWRGPEPWPSRAKLRSLDVSIIPARVVEIADSPQFPRSDLLFVETDAGSVFQGASGGPAVVWLPDRTAPAGGRIEIVGVYVGAGNYDRPLEHTGGTVQIVRKLPDLSGLQDRAPGFKD